MDVVAVTAIYQWAPPVVGLLIGAAIGGPGLALARRWNSEQFGLLVLVPLLVLAPIVADGISLLLIGFMTVLSAAALPVQLGKDWIWMHAARTVAVTLPLLAALLVASFTVVPEYGRGCVAAGRGVCGRGFTGDPRCAHPVAGHFAPGADGAAARSSACCLRCRRESQ